MSSNADDSMSRVHHAANNTEALIADLEDMVLDPTMDQCCRRDLHDSIKRERIRHALQRGDRVDARQRLAAAAVCTDGAAVAAATAAFQSPERDGSVQGLGTGLSGPHCAGQQQQLGLDVDGELLWLRQQRLQQLKQQSSVQQEQQREGFGSLNTVAEAGFIKLCVRDPPGRGLVVAHLVVQGHEPCNALDEMLEQAAGQYRGTYFVRCVVSRNTPLAAQLELPRGLPALLVVKHGVVLGKAHISQFGDSTDIWDEEVMAYLKRFKVLSTGTQHSGSGAAHAAACGQRQAAGAAANDDSDQGASSSEDQADGEEWLTPCEVCGRTYPHQHIRSIYSSHQPDSDEEDE